jgi:hypothetical protein
MKTIKKNNRFDCVEYDEMSTLQQRNCKTKFMDLAEYIETLFGNSEQGKLALVKLEESYMWIGKSIRDDQIARTGIAPLQEKRNDS